MQNTSSRSTRLIIMMKSSYLELIYLEENVGPEPLLLTGEKNNIDKCTNECECNCELESLLVVRVDLYIGDDSPEQIGGPVYQVLLVPFQRDPLNIIGLHLLIIQK